MVNNLKKKREIENIIRRDFKLFLHFFFSSKLENYLLYITYKKIGLFYRWIKKIVFFSFSVLFCYELVVVDAEII